MCLINRQLEMKILHKTSNGNGASIVNLDTSEIRMFSHPNIHKYT
jgi:hypothetical protein